MQADTILHAEADPPDPRVAARQAGPGTRVYSLPEPLLISDVEAAAMAGVSRATWWRLHAAGKTPAAVKLGRRRLWRKKELVVWIEFGCPSRLNWEAMKAGRRRAVS